MLNFFAKGRMRAEEAEALAVLVYRVAIAYRGFAEYFAVLAAYFDLYEDALPFDAA